MKMKRNMIILGAVLVLAVAFVVVTQNWDNWFGAASPTPTPEVTTDPALLSLSSYTADKVTDMTVENRVAGTTYSVYKKGDVYTIKGMESSDFDQTAMGSLVYNAANVVGERLIEQNPKDLSVYGLDTPQATVTAKYSDGTTNVFLLGDKTPSGTTNYVMKQGDNRVVTVWMNVGESYLGSTDSMLAKQKIQLAQEEVETVKIMKKGAVTVEITSTGTDSGVSISPWQIVKPWKRAVDTQALDAFLKSAVGVSMDSVVEGDAKDLAKYGLANPEYDITISGKVKTDEILVGSSKDDSYFYAKFANKNIVYTLSKSSVDFANTSAYKLMDKMIILVNITSATGVEFKGLGQQGRLDIEQKPAVDSNGQPQKDTNGNPSYDQFFSISGKTVEDKVARYFYQTCIGLPTHSLIKEGWQSSGDPVAVLTYYRNTEPSVIQIEFMAYDKDYYAVRMKDGTFFLIRQDKVQRVADDLAKLKAGTLTVPQ